MASKQEHVADKIKTNGKWHTQQMIEDNVASVADTARKFYGTVKEYPMTAAVGGLCVGLLIGAGLFARRPE